MEREAFSLQTRHVEPGPGETTAPLPTLEIHYEGPESQLQTALRSLSGDGAGTEFDVALRLQDDAEASDPAGVLAVTERVTGEFICECNVRADRIFAFLEATRRRAAAVDSSPKYRMQFIVDERPIRTEEMATLLVYAASGELRESRSLLPNGVQL